jgi:hypothetical protein
MNYKHVARHVIPPTACSVVKKEKPLLIENSDSAGDFEICD